MSEARLTKPAFRKRDRSTVMQILGTAIALQQWLDGLRSPMPILEADRLNG